jgi:ATP-dependent exoDNAse (exonuclease V) alpha subunit
MNRQHIVARITQIPLAVAAASTIHAVQGATTSRNVHIVVPPNGFFEPGMLYVALTRATSLNKITISRMPPVASNGVVTDLLPHPLAERFVRKYSL